jgi:hypothetical protein
MRGNVYKRCEEKGCRSSPNCDHPWWMTFSHNGRRFKTSVDSFAKTPVRTKTEAVKMWLPKFVTAVMENRYPQTEAVMSPPIASSTASEFLKEYRKRHCEAEKLNMDSLSWKLNVIDRRFGASL